MPRNVAAAVVLLVVAALPAVGRADVGSCPPVVASDARSLPLVLSNGGRLVVHDPSGGVLSSREASFRFTVGGRSAVVARVRSVRWSVDGARVASSSRSPFAWRGRVRSLGVGHHTVTVRATPRTGASASTSFDLVVVDCSRRE